MNKRPLFRQDMRPILDAKLLDWSAFLKSYTKAASAFHQVEAYFRTQEAQFLRALYQQKEAPFLDTFKNLKTILIFASAFEIAGLKMMIDYAQSFMGKAHQSFPKVYFFSSPDAAFFWEIVGSVDLRQTGFIFFFAPEVSDWMPTALVRCVESLQSYLPVASAFSHVLVFVPQGDNTAFFEKIFRCFEIKKHMYAPLEVGALGCFATPYLWIAELVGFQSSFFCQGARQTLTQFIARDLKSPLEGAALYDAFHLDHSPAGPIFWAPSRNFLPLAAWCQDLWSDMMASTCAPLGLRYGVPMPLTFQEPCLVTTFFEKKNTVDVASPSFLEKHPFLSQVPQMRSLFDNAVRQQIRFLTKRQNYARVFHVKSLSEETLGALSMHFMLEALLISFMKFK